MKKKTQQSAISKNRNFKLKLKKIANLGFDLSHYFGGCVLLTSVQHIREWRLSRLARCLTLMTPTFFSYRFTSYIHAYSFLCCHMTSELKGSCLFAGTFVRARLSASVITRVLLPIRRRLIECAAARRLIPPRKHQEANTRAQLPKTCRVSLFFFFRFVIIYIFFCVGGFCAGALCRWMTSVVDPPPLLAPLIESAPPLALPVIKKIPWDCHRDKSWNQTVLFWERERFCRDRGDSRRGIIKSCGYLDTRLVQ